MRAMISPVGMRRKSLLLPHTLTECGASSAGATAIASGDVADAFRAALLDEKIDPALAAEILTPLSANEIAELFEVIDPIAIAQVREALTRTLAAELADDFLAIYNANHLDEYRVDHGDIGSARCAMLACASRRLARRSWLIRWSANSIATPII